LASKDFARAPNLHRILTFICEMHFEGRDEEIKEYTIAVKALGRGPDFDPQLDPIVRVSAGNLRKRLEAHYAALGPAHQVRLVLPVGQYVPEFLHGSQDAAPAALRPAMEECHRGQGFRAGAQWLGNHWRWILLALVGIGMSLGLGFAWRTMGLPSDNLALAPGAGQPQGPEIRMAFGASQPYIDRAGRTWMPDQGCSGGKIFHHPDRGVLGTSDPELYRRGREGVFTCRIPVPKGSYELHLLFSDGFGSPVARRRVNLTINDGPAQSVDIVDQAEGCDRAVTKVYTDIQPREDGNIHLAFSSISSFINAVEVLPGTPGRMQPLRITAAPHAFRDQRGQIWLPDQYVFGGSVNRRHLGTRSSLDAGLFEYEHLGRCRYVLPVAQDQLYSIRLYFSEAWFGDGKMVAGGPGSRVFDVHCNGLRVLEGLDILKKVRPGQEAVVETLAHVLPTKQGTLEISLWPRVEYPLINAIEVVSEGPGR